MASINVIEVRKSYGAHEVIHSISLDIADGDFVVLVGPSGCGKSTLLRMIAGLESITSGVVKIGSRVVNKLAPKDRDIAMVFQNYALYPHKTVAENMGFGLKLRRASKSEIETRVRRAAEILDVAPSSTAIRGSFPAASVSVWRWGAPSCVIRKSSFLTSRCRISTPNCACRCAPKSRNCISG